MNSKLLTATFLLLNASSAFSEMLPLSEAREHRFGGIVSNRGNAEELFLGCVEMNADKNCVQYRFIVQSGDTYRVLGNQEVQPFEHPALYAKRNPIFGKDFVVFKTLDWVAEGFSQEYGEDGGLWEEGPNSQMFASLVPIVGLPGLGTPIFVVCVAYDATRLAVLMPFRVVNMLAKNARTKNSRRAYSALFNGKLRNRSGTSELNEKLFEDLKGQLTQISTAK